MIYLRQTLSENLSKNNKYRQKAWNFQAYTANEKYIINKNNSCK